MYIIYQNVGKNGKEFALYLQRSYIICFKVFGSTIYIIGKVSTIYRTIIIGSISLHLGSSCSELTYILHVDGRAVIHQDPHHVDVSSSSGQMQGRITGWSSGTKLIRRLLRQKFPAHRLIASLDR